MQSITKSTRTCVRGEMKVVHGQNCLVCSKHVLQEF